MPPFWSEKLRTGKIVKQKPTDLAVFAEPSGRRWNSTVILFGSILGTVCFLLVILAIGAFSPPDLTLRAKYSFYQKLPDIKLRTSLDALSETPVQSEDEPDLVVELPAEVPDVTTATDVKPAIEITPVTGSVNRPKTIIIRRPTNIVPIPVIRAATEPAPRPVAKSPIKPTTSPSIIQLNTLSLHSKSMEAPQTSREETQLRHPNNKTRPKTQETSATDIIFNFFSGLIVSSAHAQELPATSNPKVFAVIDAWDPQGMASAYAHEDEIDLLMPKHLSLSDDGRAIQIAPLTFEEHPKLAIDVAPVFEVPTVNRAHAIKFNETTRLQDRRRNLIEELVSYVMLLELSGLTVSIDNFEKIDEQSYLQFAVDLKTELDAHGLVFFHILPTSTDPELLRQLNALSDALVIKLGYENALSKSTGPLASQSWVENEISKLSAKIPLHKVVIATPNIAVDRREDGVAKSLTLQDAYRLADRYSATPATDPVSKNATFNFVDDEGLNHTVWMLDSISVHHQLKTLVAASAYGFAMTELGEEDASMWALFDAEGIADEEKLYSIDTAEQIHYLDDGEVFSIARLPKAGKRERVVLDEEQNQTQLQMTQLPNGFEIQLSGASDKKMIALTFDDGPDPRYTPQVLDILEKLDVPATFFPVGEHMLDHPDLVEEIIAAGHDIGSHTFSHVNISSLDRRLLNLELNSAQVVFQSITGRNMALFRAPFSADAWPVTVEQIASLVAVSENGYLSVGAAIDPRDWSNPDSDRIISDVVTPTKSGNGQIIMLHDGGGNRAQTVAALPTIITQLQDAGYNFVTVAEFLNLNSDDVMPPVLEENVAKSTFIALGFGLLRWGEITLKYVFILAIILGCARALIIMGLSFFKRSRAATTYDENLSIGVVIPAHNEAEVIVKTVNSVLRSNHGNINVLVVDDGSTDDTYQRCLRAFRDNSKVRVVSQQNAGKSAALNLGFSLIDSEIVVALDADTVFDKQTISLMARHFSDPKVAAVSGNAKVGNRTKLLTRWQALEYIVAQNLDRRAFDYLNCITVVPGAVGAWRREAVLALGGFGSDTLAEDADLTVRLLRAGYRITYEEHAIARTEAPETVKQFSKQRLRWMFGMMQVGCKNAGALKLKDSKSVGLVAIPNILIFQILFPLIAPIADFTALCVLVGLVVKLITNSELIGLSESLYFLVLFGAFILLDFTCALVAFWHESKEDKKLLFWLIPQRFYYRQLIYIAAIQSLISAIKGQGVTWGHLRRTGSVISPAE